MTYKVFISYSTNDLPIVSNVKRLLETNPVVEAFIAEYSISPGSHLDESIVNAIKDCDLFILLWSRNSCSSEYVRTEVGIARGKEKTILPIVLEKNLELPPFIRDLKYLGAYRNPEESLTWLQTHVFTCVNRKQMNGFALFALGVVLGAALIWLLSRE